MKFYIKYSLIYFFVGLVSSCAVETETHIVETPVLDLKVTGPLFEGSNTATATWEYSLEELFPEINNEIVIEGARVSTIKIIPKADIDYPELGKVVMEMKPKNNGMTRIGLLETNFDKSNANSLNVAEVQEDFDEAFVDERLTFVGDFDLLAEEYFDDLAFDLIVTFEIQTRK
jgi:hypothetical protein